MTLLSKDMLKSISFNSLNFVKPFSELGSPINQYRNKPVLLCGVGEKPGILIVRYVDLVGVSRYNFKSIEHCLGNAARRVYQILTGRGIQEIEFAVIPTEVKYHSRILKRLKEQYFNSRTDQHFEIIKPWLEEGLVENFPIDILAYRRPFMKHNDSVRFSFYDYKNKAGLYIIREKSVPENSMVTVYVGQSGSVLHSRIKDKFYPNPHLYYKEVPGVLEYHISMIEVLEVMMPKGRTLREYEDILINILRPRDNKIGKGLGLNGQDVGGYIPFLKEGEEF